MAEYNNDFSGVLFTNDRRSNENQPNYNGKCMIGGNDFKVSGWNRVSAAGNPYTGLVLSDENGGEHKGALFVVDDRPTEKYPNFRGSVEINGNKFRVSCWEKISKNGNPYRSLAFSVDERETQAAAASGSENPF